MSSNLSLPVNKVDVLYASNREELKIFEQPFVRVGVWDRRISASISEYVQFMLTNELENQDWIIKAKDLAEVRENLDMFPEGHEEICKEGRELFLDDITRLCYIFSQFSYASYFKVKVLFSRATEYEFQKISNGKVQLFCSYEKKGITLKEAKARKTSLTVNDYAIALIKKREKDFREYLYCLGDKIEHNACEVIIEEYELNH